MSVPTPELDDQLDVLLDAAESKTESKLRPDKNDDEEEASHRRSLRVYELELRREELQSRRAERALRERYADKVFSFLIYYCCFVGLVIICIGCDFSHFKLDKLVVAALVGSTAISAIGVVSTVVRGLFPAQRMPHVLSQTLQAVGRTLPSLPSSKAD